MAEDTLITQSRLKEVLRYDPETGMFTWLVSLSNRAPAGADAGGLDDDGYRLISIDGRLYQAHRLAVLYMAGVWPPEQTDHANRIPSDNRWKNLRPATRGQNQQNSKPRGVSRFKGVSWRKDCGKWQAQAKLNGKQHYLGLYHTEELASAAYATFAREHFPDFMRLS